MPSAEPIPSLKELLDAFNAELAARDDDGDTHEASDYEEVNGPSALLFRRLAERDRDEFRQIYFAHATDDRLTEYVRRRFRNADGTPRERVQLARGVGTAVVQRASAAGGGGTILAGTRIGYGRGGTEPLRYLQVLTDRVVGAAELIVSDLEVEAETPGSAGTISGDRGDIPILRIEDPLWDNSWVVNSVDCAAGTNYETDDQLRANVRQEKLDRRPGYPDFIKSTCVAAGADTVVLFPSDFLGDELDCGLNRVYVGDANYQTTAALLLACRLAMPSAAMAGAGVQVLPMTNTTLTITATLRFWDVPERFNLDRARDDAMAAIVEYFAARENPFYWRAASIRGAILRAVRGLQTVDLATSLAEPVLSSLFGTVPLPRYLVAPANVTILSGAPA